MHMGTHANPSVLAVMMLATNHEEHAIALLHDPYQCKCCFLAAL